MLQTQVNYWNLQENKRHNYASEEAAMKQAEASMQQAQAAIEQTKIGWANAQSNALNAATNARNADTNLFNAQVNQSLGLANLEVARGNLQVANKLADSNILLNTANTGLTNQKTKTEGQITMQENIRTNMLPQTILSDINQKTSQASLNSQKEVESRHSVVQNWVSTISGAIKDVGSLLPHKSISTVFKGVQ